MPIKVHTDQEHIPGQQVSNTKDPGSTVKSTGTAYKPILRAIDTTADGKKVNGMDMANSPDHHKDERIPADLHVVKNTDTPSFDERNPMADTTRVEFDKVNGMAMEIW
jgi:hypothetical protein